MTILGIIGLINLLACIPLSLFVLLQNPKASANRTYFWFNFNVAIFSLGYWLWQSSNNEVSALFWFRFLFIGIALISPAYIHNIFILLDLIKDKTHRLILTGIYLINIVFIGMDLSLLLFTGLEPRFGLGYWPTPTYFFHIYLAFWFFQCFYGFYHLLNGYVHSSGEKRKQIVYFMVAAAVGLLGGATNWFVWYKIPIPPYLNILITAYVFIFAYAITKHRLMNISLAISRTAAWSIAAGLLGVIYLVLVMLYRTFIFPGVDTVFIAFSVLYGIAAGVSFQNIRFFIQTGADKAFIKGWYDYRKVQRKLTSELRRAFSIDDVVSVIKKNLDEQVDISRVSVLLPDKAGDFASPEMRIPADSDLIKTMLRDREILLKNESPALPDELCVPCFSVDDLSALIILGKKRSEDPYNEQDFDLLETISDEISDSIYRIKPYEEVKTEYENTQKKLVETEKMLARSARLSSLAILTAGVTHEIRNPLGIIRMGIDKLDDETRSVEYLKEFKSKYLKHVDRIASIIDRMLYLSKAKAPIETEIDINSLIKEYIVELVAVKNVRIETQLSDIPKIKGISDDIYQVIINLTNNAVKAMPDGGTLIYKTYTGEENGNKTAVLEVIDTGIGIPRENLEKIFDPFFSTYHEGTGLGLAIAHKIIVDLHGRIEVESVVGKGSTFKVIIPAFNT